MPQISTKPHDAKKLIDASMPKNISAEDKLALEAKWNEAADKRNEAIARETKIPTEPSMTLRYQLRKFGHWWNAYASAPNGKYYPLLNAPSLLSSAMDAITDKMSEEALK